MAKPSKIAIKRLSKEIQDIKDHGYTEFSFEINENNILDWTLIIFGPSDTPYEGGTFKATIKFPEDYPYNPPNVKFISDLYHPNIYATGKEKGNVCISILHVGKDEFGYEHESERWKPAQSVVSVLLSIISMIADPNPESPANVDAAKMFRDDYDQYKKLVYECVKKSNM
jgi:ubiquitin-conjugating enzyme E2 G1